MLTSFGPTPAAVLAEYFIALEGHGDACGKAHVVATEGPPELPPLDFTQEGRLLLDHGMYMPLYGGELASSPRAHVHARVTHLHQLSLLQQVCTWVVQQTCPAESNDGQFQEASWLDVHLLLFIGS